MQHLNIIGPNASMDIPKYIPPVQLNFAITPPPYNETLIYR